jgi:hypothetical protein
MKRSIVKFSHEKYQGHIKEIHDLLCLGPRSKETSEAYTSVRKLIRRSALAVNYVQMHTSQKRTPNLWTSLLLFRTIRRLRHQAKRVVFRVRESKITKEKRSTLEKQFGGFADQILSLENIAIGFVINHLPSGFSPEKFFRFLDFIDTGKKGMIWGLRELNNRFTKQKRLGEIYVFAIMLKLTLLGKYNDDKVIALVKDVLKNRTIKKVLQSPKGQDNDAIMLIINALSTEELHKALELADAFGYQKINKVIGQNKLLALEHLIYYQGIDWIAANAKKLKAIIDPKKITQKNIEWLIQILRSKESMTDEETIRTVQQIFGNVGLSVV